MAEKYGTIPKKFTKAWWEYFWMYYKFHTIAVVAVVLAIGFTVYQNLTTEKFDTVLTYAGSNYYSEDVVTKLCQTLSPLCDDLDENSEKSLNFLQYQLSEEISDPEYAYAISTKLMLTIAEDEAYIYIMDKGIAERYIGEDTSSCAFAPLKDWLAADISGKETFSAHGLDYGIELSDCKLLNDIGADFSGQYLFIRYYPREDRIKQQLEGYKSAIALANKILTE